MLPAPHLRSFRAVLLFVLCAPDVASQVELPSAARCVHEWPEALPPVGLTMTAAQPCRLGDDLRRDVALLRATGGTPGGLLRALVYLPDCGRAHACVPLASVLDFTTVSRSDRPELDGLLALGIDGTLTWFACDPGQQVPGARVVGSWPGTTRLWAVDSGTSIEIFGLDSTGIRLRRATWSGSALGPVSTVVTLPGTLEVLGMDWDGDGLPEIVIGGLQGVTVRGWTQQSPIPIASLPPVQLPLSGAPPLLEVSRSSAGRDLLVSAVSDGTGTVVFWANDASSGFLPLPDTAIAAAATYDRDGDGDDDVALADALHSRLHVLLREGSSFRLHRAPLLIGSAVPDGGLSSVAGADLDGDGDGDLVAWSAGSGITHTFFDGLVDDRGPRWAVGDWTSAAVGPSTTIPVTVGLPRALAAMVPPGGTAEVRFDGWLIDPTTGLVVPQSVLAHSLPLAGVASGAVVVPLTFPVPAAWTADFVLQLHIGVEARTPAGQVHSFPQQLLYLTPSAAREAMLLALVAFERTGNRTAEAAGKWDGGGDGNVLGKKTTQHDIGRPPF